jgi:hypothetical protein
MKMFLAKSLPLLREAGRKAPIALSLRLFARLALGEEKPERAARLLGAAEVLRESAGVQLKSHLPPRERERYSRDLAAARASLGEEVFASEWAAGSALALEQAVAYAMEEEM